MVVDRSVESLLNVRIRGGDLARGGDPVPVRICAVELPKDTCGDVNESIAKSAVGDGVAVADAGSIEGPLRVKLEYGETFDGAKMA